MKVYGETITSLGPVSYYTVNHKRNSTLKEVTLIFLIKQPDANISSVISVEIVLPVSFLVILWINSIEKNSN